MEEKAERNFNELSKLRNKKTSIIKKKNINIKTISGFILFLLLFLNISLLITLLLNLNRYYYPKENENYSENQYQSKSKSRNKNNNLSYNLKINETIKIDSKNNYLKNKFKEEIIFLEECLNGNDIEKFEKYENPKLSILIPFYNSEKYVNRLLRSIQRQKIKELEIIFIDDCSLDNGPLLLEKYQKLDKRIKIVKNKINKGNLFTYIKGILSAKAKHLLIIDADDMMLSKLKEQYDISEKNDKDINDFSFISGKINMIEEETIIKDSEQYQPKIREICNNGKYPCPCFITKKIFKTKTAVKAVKTIQENYLNSHILLFADVFLFITIFEHSNSYQSYGNLFNQFYINNTNSITKPTDTKHNQIFNDILYLSQYIYQLNNSTKILNDRIQFCLNSLNWPLLMCGNKTLNINIEHLNILFIKFLNDININIKNKNRIKLLIKKIKKKLNKTLIINESYIKL